MDQTENKQSFDKKFILINIIFLIFFSINYSQEIKQIEIISAGSFDRNEALYPDGNILKKDKDVNVHLRHEDLDIYSNTSIFFQKENSVISYGKVKLIQGDTLQLFCDSLNYDGKTKQMFAFGKVRLINSGMTLETNKLKLDRNIDEAYFFNGGKIIDKKSTISSINGKYLIHKNKYEFERNVKVLNDSRIIESKKMHYDIESEKSYFFDETIIKGDNYKINCDAGFYDPIELIGIFNKNAIIESNERIVHGDSIYFDEEKKYASISNNIKIIDNKEKLVLTGDYGELFEEKDSAIITKNPLAINILKRDSLFVKADTLYSVGKEGARTMKGIRNVKFLQGNFSGKADFIEIKKSLGLTIMERKEISEKDLQIFTESEINKKNPVLWDNYSQISGDKIIFTENLDTNELDSIKITNNVFILEKDSISESNFNQIKGLKLDGKFLDNKLKNAVINQNAELIYYMYNDKNNLIGIDKAISSLIQIHFNNKSIDEILFMTDPEGILYPENFLDPNETILNGFIDRSDEKISNKSDLIEKEI